MNTEYDPQKDTDRKETAKWLLIAGSIGILTLPLLLTRSTCLPSFMNTGEVGDTIGGISAPIVGIIGAILVYFALDEQIKANKLINDQFLDQKKTTIQQNFEQTFFNMLNIHHEIVDKIKFSNNEWDLSLKTRTLTTNGMKGILEKSNADESVIEFNRKHFRSGRYTEKHDNRDFFKYSVEVLEDLIKFLDESSHTDYIVGHNTKKHRIPNSQNEIETAFHSAYGAAFKAVDSNLGHYYRNLYRIIKMISEQKFGETDEKSIYEKQYFYTSIVRSQLSDYEIRWLFYNGLHDNGKKFRPFIEEYTLLKILDGYSNDPIKKLKPLYRAIAFKKIEWIETNDPIKEKIKPEKKNYIRKPGQESNIESD